jgi:MFS family permease
LIYLKILFFQQWGTNLTVKVFANLDLKTRRNLITLFFSSFLFWLSLTSLLPVLPAYVEDLGGSKQQVGFVMGSFAIGLLLSRTLWGKIADQKGRKKVVLIGTLVAGIAPLGYLLMNTIGGLMVARAFHGVSIAAFTIGYSALVVDLAPSEKRGEIVGYMGLALPIGMTLGPALGSLLQENIGYFAVFTSCIVAGLIALLLTMQIEETKSTQIDFNLQESDFLMPSRSFSELMSNMSFLVPTLVLLIGGTVFGVLITFLPLFIRSLNFEFSAGLFYTTAAIASFLIRIVTGRASDQYGRGLFIVMSLVSFSLSMILLSHVHNPISVIVAAIFEGISSGLLIPLMIVLISDRCYLNERGKAYALCLGGYDLGIAIAGPGFGYLAEKISFASLFMIAGSLNIIALFIFLTQSNKTVVNSLKFAVGLSKDYHALTINRE